MAIRNRKANRAQNTARKRISLKPGENYKAHELKAVAAGTRPEVLAQRRKIMRKFRADKELRDERRVSWATDRKIGIANKLNAHPPEVYEWLFQVSFGKPILEALEKIAGKKRFIRILEDGAGNGRFLQRIKAMLAGKGVKCEATAVVLGKPLGLETKNARTTIDRIVECPAEAFIPSGPYGFIVSVAGSIAHANPKLVKPQLLKYLYSLEKGGIALFNFEFSDFAHRFDSKRAKKDILEHLKKLGFEGKFVSMDDVARRAEEGGKDPIKTINDKALWDILIVERKR